VADAPNAWTSALLIEELSQGRTLQMIADHRGVTRSRVQQVCKKLGVDPKKYWYVRKYKSRTWPPPLSLTDPEVVAVGEWFIKLGFQVEPGNRRVKRRRIISVYGPPGQWIPVRVHSSRPHPVRKDYKDPYYRLRIFRQSTRHVVVLTDGRIVLIPHGRFDTCMPIHPKNGYWAERWCDSMTASKYIVDRWLQFGELLPRMQEAL
jgi:hypothetical protein